MTDLTEAIRRERTALIDLLETLTPPEWATPSLCEGWTVQDVAAHLAWAADLSPRDGVVELVRAGFRPNELVAASARRWSRRGPTAILNQLRGVAERSGKPFGVPMAAVAVDAVVHSVDIRRPLGRPAPSDPTAFAVAADFCAEARWPSSMLLGGGGGRRIRGLRLVATDQPWVWGAGPEVRGAGEALILVLGGRGVSPGELQGPGAPVLYGRL